MCGAMNKLKGELYPVVFLVHATPYAESALHDMILASQVQAYRKLTVRSHVISPVALIIIICDLKSLFSFLFPGYASCDICVVIQY